jgi:hypothetical protein
MKCLQWLRGDAGPQGHTFPHTLYEARTWSKHFVGIITQDFSRLNRIISQHEEALRRIWLSKTAEEKTAILQKARSRIPKRTTRVWGSDKSTDLFDFIAPHINVEDLLTPGAFITFMSSRGRNRPESFAFTELTYCGVSDEIMGANNLQSHVMACVSSHGMSYGQIALARDVGGARKFLLRGQGVRLVKGILILQIQIAIYSFLARCGDIMLSTPHEPSAPKSINIRKKAVSGSRISEHGFRSIKDDARKSPFAFPAPVDLSSLRALVYAKLADLEDHVWALRSDPGYFEEVWNSHYENRPEMIRAFDGQRHPLNSGHREFAILSSVVRDVVTNSFSALSAFQEVAGKIEKLDAAFKRPLDRSGEEEDAAETLASLFLELRIVLWDITNQLRQTLAISFITTPGLRKFWFRTNFAPISHINIPFSYRRTVVDKSPVTRRLFDIIKDIIDMASMDFRFSDFYDCVLRFEDLMEEEPEAKQYISPYVASLLSHFSVAAECTRQLRLCHPWSIASDEDIEKMIWQDPFALMMRPTPMDPMLEIWNYDQTITQLSDPTDGRFKHPLDKPRTRKTVLQMRAAEDNLERFWIAMDKFTRRKTGKTWFELLEHDISSRHCYRRTEPWTNTAKMKSPRSHEERTSLVSAYVPIEEWAHDVSLDVTGNFKRLDIKEKQKTRRDREPSAPTQDCTPTQVPEVRGLPDESVNSAKYLVDQRSLKVFSSLFYTPGARHIPGEIPWTEFLHAMVEVGFSVVSLPGSAWHFARDANNSESIQIHEPHPNSKLSFIQLRRIGHRLADKYGWTGDMFQLK